MERVRILISLGREVTTEVVYKGFLYPLGFRAALLKVTERQYLPWPNSFISSDHIQGPLAFQVQRYFIQISNPTKTFPGSNQPFAGRGWPARTLTMLTQRTPDLLFPTAPSHCENCAAWSEAPNGRLDQDVRSGLVFWPRTGPGERGNVRFRFTVDGRPEPVSTPLIFVDNQAAHDAPTMRELQRYWNDPTARAGSPDPKDAAFAAYLDAWKSLRRLDHAGARRRYADEDKSGDTTFETLNWDVRVDSREVAVWPRYLPADKVAAPASEPPSNAWLMNSAMESDDQPPFYPRCLQATIRHDGVGRLTGNGQPDISVRFLDDYLTNGLPAAKPKKAADAAGQTDPHPRPVVWGRSAAATSPSGETNPGREAFLGVVDKTPPTQTMGRNGERASGVMRPEMDYAFIGRKGPIGTPKGTLPITVPVNVAFDSVMPDARICGLVSLQSIIQQAKAEAKAQVAPLLRQTVEYGLQDIAGDANAAAKSLATSLLGALTPILKKFQAGDATAQLLQSAYPDALSAIERLEPALDDMKQHGIAALPDTVDAVRDLVAVLDRLAADPLGPLTDLAQNQLSDAGDNLKQKATAAFEAKITELDPASVSNALRDAFVPLGNALVALGDTLDVLQPLLTESDAKELAAHASRAFAKATRDSFSLPPEKMPNDLKALEQTWHEKVKAALAGAQVHGVEQSKVEKFHPELETAWAGIEGLPVPVVLDRFYAALVALLRKDWRAAIKALGKDGIDRLRLWVGSQIGGACASAGPKLADAVKALRGALLATTIPHPCEPSLCTSPSPPAAAAEICARLWALCARAELHDQVVEVSAALARLTAALKSFGEGDPCLPTPVEVTKRLVDQLRALDTARASFGHALAEFLKALPKAAEKGMEDAAAHEAAVLTAALIALLRPPSAAFDHLKTALEPAMGATAATQAVDALQSADKAIGAAQDALEKAKSLTDLREALAQLGDAAKPTKVLDDLIETGWRAVGDTLLAAALPAATVADEAVTTLLQAMAAFLKAAQDARNSAVDKLRKIDEQLDLRGEEQLASMLFLYPPDAPPTPGTDKLDVERKRVDKALLADPATRADELASLLKAWFIDGKPSVELIIHSLGERVLAAARHKLLRVLDVDGLRNQLQEALNSLIPARRRFEYAWAADPIDKEFFIGEIVSFRGGGFHVNAEATLDLKKPSEPVTGHVSGTIGDFDIGMKLGGVPCLTLFFSGIAFEASPGAPARVEEPKLKSFRPEGSLLFLAGLAAYCKMQDGDASTQSDTADGAQVPNGIYTIPRPNGGAGLRAGYGLSFGAVQIGTMAILDVVFDAHVELPFDGDAGHAQLSLSTPEKPATLVCAPYGGTAYATLRSVPKLGQSDLATEFDVGFQFGAAVAIEFGVLSGAGRVMTGLRVFQVGDSPGFSALFVAAFEGHIACFGIAASFVLAMTYQDSQLTGEATLTYSFSLGPLKKSFSVKVSRNAGGGLENRSASLDLPDWDGPTIMLANASSDDLPASKRDAYLRSNVPGMMQNWPQYTARYGIPDKAIGRRRRS